MQLLFTGGFGKEQWDSYPIPDDFSFPASPQSLFIKYISPEHKFVPSPKVEKPDATCFDICDFSTSWISFSLVCSE